MWNANLAAMLTLTIADFDADPDAVTKILDLAPTSVVRRGEPRRRGRPYEFNTWHLEVHAGPLVNGREHAEAIAKLIAQLRGREYRFLDLANTLKPARIYLYGGFYVSGEQQGIWLDPGEMAVLAACGISWGLDLFEAVKLN